MFEKLTGGKKKKEVDIFSIPDKKYSTDHKAISKMSTKALVQLYHDQQKYISGLAEKIELARLQQERVQEKVDELSQKNEVVNSQVARMTNEHEQLSIKFDNLQCSLEILSSEAEVQLGKEIQFLKEQQVTTDKLKTMSAVTGIYREQYVLCKKIEHQNKNIKGRYSQLEEQFEELENKVKELEKEKTYNNLIPTLMQEIHELKAKKEGSQTEGENQSKMEERILLKFKSQVETASTVRSSEEEEELQSKQADIQKLMAQLTKEKGKNRDLSNENQELSQSIQGYSGRISKMQREAHRLQQSKEELQLKHSKLQQNNKTTKTSLQQQLLKTQQNCHLQTDLKTLQKDHNLIKSTLQQTETDLKSKHEQASQLGEQYRLTLHQLTTASEELVREQEKNMTLEKMFNSKNSSEVENLMQLKMKIEGELGEVKKSLDGEKKVVIQSEGKLQKMSEDNQNLTLAIKRIGEEKAIIQENVNNCLKISQEDSEQLKHKNLQEATRNDELQQNNENLTQKIKQCQQDLKNYQYQTETLAKTIQVKENELKKTYNGQEQLQKDKGGLQQQIDEKEEEAKIRARKHESELNQERIKLESVNRKLNIHENQAEENKANLAMYYEQNLSKDKKISQMEIKLKDYKYRIQVLRKEKHDIENTYEHKLSSLQPEEPGNVLRISENTLESKNSEDKECLFDEEKDQLKNELFSLKEENLAILAENSELRESIQALNGTVCEKNRNIKILQEKRDNIMKEIQKIGHPKPADTPVAVPVLSQLRQSQNEGRQKRIASKALKGFEILIKLSQELYKTFVCVFGQQMEKDAIKGLERQINAIIKRSNDMKDVFQGYLD